jgi:hypothetical protein
MKAAVAVRPFREEILFMVKCLSVGNFSITTARLFAPNYGSWSILVMDELKRLARPLAWWILPSRSTPTADDSSARAEEADEAGYLADPRRISDK